MNELMSQDSEHNLSYILEILSLLYWIQGVGEEFNSHACMHIVYSHGPMEPFVIDGE